MSSYINPLFIATKNKTIEHASIIQKTRVFSVAVLLFYRN